MLQMGFYWAIANAPIIAAPGIKNTMRANWLTRYRKIHLVAACRLVNVGLV